MGTNSSSLFSFLRILIASKTIEAALAFYKALKVYPTPKDLIDIYDKTVDKVSGGHTAPTLPAPPVTQPPFRSRPASMFPTLC